MGKRNLGETMQRSQHANNKTVITSMLSVLDKFEILAKQSRSLSTTSKFLSNIKSLRLTYQKLDDNTKEKVDCFMCKERSELLLALKKSGSQISNSLQLAGMIDDNLIVELRRLLNEALSILEKDEAGLTTIDMEDIDVSVSETGTFKVLTKDLPDLTNLHSRHDQLKIALESPNLNKTSPSYLAHTTFGMGDSVDQGDSLDIIISSFEILYKSRKNKDKLLGEITPQFTEIYHQTLLRELNRLRFNTHQRTLNHLAIDFSLYPNMRKIRKLLRENEKDRGDELCIAVAENISILIDKALIEALQQKKDSLNQDNIRFRR